MNVPLSRWLVGITLGLGLAAPSAAAAREVAGRNALNEGAPREPRPVPSSATLDRVSVIRHHPQLGVPTFVFASRTASDGKTAKLRAAATAASVARDFLADYAPLYGLTRADVSRAEVSHLHDTGFGPVIVSYRQRVAGIEVFREKLNVVLDAQHALVGFTGYLSPLVPALASVTDLGPRFKLSPTDALARAYADDLGAPVTASLFQTEGAASAAGYQRYELANGTRTVGGRVFAGSPRVKRVLFELPDTLEPAYYVEVQSTDGTGTSTDASAYVLSARDGRVLFRKNLVADDSVYKYKVWADPSGKFIPWDGPLGNSPTPSTQAPGTTYVPPYVTPNVVSLQNSPFSKNDPWLPSGATETVGNNVDAYVDLSAPDGRSGGDYRAPITGNDASHSYDVTQSPTATTEQRYAAITTLFFANNFFHDWYYDVGFDEASGNAQTANFGRGGVEGDPVHAEAQDYSGTNNANMMTPADGASPRMQMYRFTVQTPNRDGDLDMTVVGHEWGHYISNRLIGDAAGLDTNTGGGMGEGWADFHALLLTTRATDIAVAQNANWAGYFPMGVYVYGNSGSHEAYYGIRRAPYSVDFTRNGLTFIDIHPNHALGTGFPVSFGEDGADNDEVHNIGEVWASMLWECYVTLLRDPRYTFQQAQDRMKAYLVASYKLTPSSPTFVDARDAMLAAVYATDAQDFTQFAAAFARRGLGTGAVEGTDRTEVGLKESFTVGADLALQSVTVEEQKWCDNDGIIDANETGVVTVKVRNTGVTALKTAHLVVSSDNPNVILAHGGALDFPSIAPYSVGTATLAVTLKPITDAEPAHFTATVTDSELANPRTFTGRVAVMLNADAVPQSKTESFDAPQLVWTNVNPLSDAGIADFIRIPANDGGVLHARDPGFGSDQSLVSPPIQLSGALQFSFDHRYQLENDGVHFYDGAHVEASINDGGTWLDLGSSMTVGYNGTVYAYSGSPNPLAGLGAYVGQSDGFPSYVTEHVLTTSSVFTGKTVRVRFRLGADEASGAPGWDIDNVAFTGINNAPFPGFIANRAICVDHPPVITLPDTFTVHEGEPVTLAATVTDEDNTNLTYVWTELSGPNVDLIGADSPNLKLKAPSTGGAPQTMVFKLSVSDGTLTTEAMTAVNVEANHPPVAKITGTPSGKAGGTVTLSSASSTDPDADVLTSAWKQTSGPPATSTGATSASFAITLPGTAKKGDVLNFQLTVKDPAGASAVASATVTVTEAAGCACGASADPSAVALPFAALVLLLALNRRGRS